VRQGNAWSQQDKLVGSIGCSVDIEGDTAISGFCGNFTSANVYVRDGATWSRLRQLVGGNGETDIYSGISTALSNNKAMVAGYIFDLVDEQIYGESALAVGQEAVTTSIFNVTNNSPTPLGSTTTFTATGAAAGDITYTWAFGDGEEATTNEAITSHTYQTVGVYAASVTAASPTSAVTATTIVTIQQGVTNLLATNDSPTEIGQATMLTATIAAGADVAYTWAFGDGQTATGSVVTHTYPALGVYTAVITASNLVSLVTGTTQVAITDEAITGLLALNNSPVPVNSATSLTATVTAGTNVSYTWDFGNGQTGGGAIVTHTYQTPGNYTAVVTASNSISLVTATTTVAVEELVAGLVAINDSPTPLDQATTLTATLTAGTNVTYTWAFGDGQTDSGPGVSHIYPAIGNYTAVVTAGNPVSLVTATTAVTITDQAITGLTATNDSPTLLGDPTQLLASIEI
jgi:PKD repeat protein